MSDKAIPYKHRANVYFEMPEGYDISIVVPYGFKDVDDVSDAVIIALARTELSKRCSVDVESANVVVDRLE